VLEASTPVCDLMCLQYCNGGDLADYLQGVLFVYDNCSLWKVKETG